MTQPVAASTVYGKRSIILRTPGVAGPPGPPSSSYVYLQATPSATWSIAHNLGFRPSVQVFDSGSQKIEGDVSHSSLNTVSIMFAVPTAGFARLN
jgi:hypothetical protein